MCWWESRTSRTSLPGCRWMFVLPLDCSSGPILVNSLQLKSDEQLKYRKGFRVELQSQVCCIQLLMFALWLGAGDIIFDMRCQVWEKLCASVCGFCSPQGVKVLNQLAGSADGPEQLHRYTHTQRHIHRRIHMHILYFLLFWCFDCFLHYNFIRGLDFKDMLESVTFMGLDKPGQLSAVGQYQAFCECLSP